MHQRGLPAAGVLGLSQCIDHQPGDQFVAAVHGSVAVGSIVADLQHEVLLCQPLQHGHHRRVGKVAARRQRFVDLANGLGFRPGPQMVHDRAFQIPQPCQLGHCSFISCGLKPAYSGLLLAVVSKPAGGRTGPMHPARKHYTLTLAKLGQPCLSLLRRATTTAAES
ncbi:hypothetical protein BN9982_1840009 [Mycobacterium tuberculosis]|nr:hypothetical protein BN9982_1840009 [Mycobacterium tuberculosis]